jgi:hypothetical protein
VLSAFHRPIVAKPEVRENLKKEFGQKKVALREQTKRELDQKKNELKAPLKTSAGAGGQRIAGENEKKVQ